MKLDKFVIFIFAALTTLFVEAQSGRNNPGSQTAWRTIAPYFHPPAEFRNGYGNFRSPLLFYNGDSVTTPAGWEKRRREILGRWHKMMGPWPAVITGRQFEFIDTVRRENFTQYKIRFFWLPGEQTDGYLLVPDGKGDKPAVITVFYEPETAVGVGGKP